MYSLLPKRWIAVLMGKKLFIIFLALIFSLFYYLYLNTKTEAVWTFDADSPVASVRVYRTGYPPNTAKIYVGIYERDNFAITWTNRKIYVFFSHLNTPPTLATSVRCSSYPRIDVKQQDGSRKPCYIELDSTKFISPLDGNLTGRPPGIPNLKIQTQTDDLIFNANTLTYYISAYIDQDNVGNKGILSKDEADTKDDGTSTCPTPPCDLVPTDPSAPADPRLFIETTQGDVHSNKDVKPKSP